MEKKITLFHGSEKVIEHPVFGEGKKHNDFGLGFYCTESEALAKEWAVSSGRFCKPLYSGYGISAGFTFEQPGLYHSQLDRRAGRASSIFHKNAGGKAGQAISDRQFQRERKCL